MKRTYFKDQTNRIFLLVFFASFMALSVHSQQIYVGDNAVFYLNDASGFTTGNTVVEKSATGRFLVAPGNNWGSATEYVDGTVEAEGTGKTKLPTGNNGVYAPVTIEHTSSVTAEYFNQAPATGSLGTGVDAVATTEYWELTGKGILTLPWNADSGIQKLVDDNGGELKAVAVVGLQGGTWNLVSAPATNVVTGDAQNGDVTTDANQEVDFDQFSQLTFGIDHQLALAVTDLFKLTGINLLSNPVDVDQNYIRFRTEEDLKGLQVTLYDINGRLVKKYEVTTHEKKGRIVKPSLRSGIYFMRFNYEGKQGTKKIIIK